MSTGKHCEIERKYLIRYPDIEALKARQGVEQWEIVQIYLTVPGPGETRRIRRVTCDGEVRYFKTEKRRLTSLSCVEDEGEIDQLEYIRLSQEQQPGCKPLGKTRYRIPYQGHVLEFDVYPFWTDRAIMEVELTDEAEEITLPRRIRILREVSNDKRYTNASISREIPKD